MELLKRSMFATFNIFAVLDVYIVLAMVYATQEAFKNCVKGVMSKSYWYINVV